MVVRFFVYGKKGDIQGRFDEFRTKLEAERYVGVARRHPSNEGVEFSIVEKDVNRKTEEKAREIFEAFQESHDIVEFMESVAKWASVFGVHGEYNRSLFTDELKFLLSSNGSSQLPPQTAKLEAAVSWSAEDIRRMRKGMTQEDAVSFLEENKRHIRDSMIIAGRGRIILLLENWEWEQQRRKGEEGVRV